LHQVRTHETKPLVSLITKKYSNMRLTRQADYSLRVLLYLSTDPQKISTIGEIAQAYGVSAHHLAKVAQLLRRRGYVELLRGQQGGLRLQADPKTVTVGDVVRDTEPNFDLLECFDSETNTCPLDSHCLLKGVFKKAKRRFLETLDQHTLAEMAAQPETIIQALLPADRLTGRNDRNEPNRSADGTHGDGGPHESDTSRRTAPSERKDTPPARDRLDEDETSRMTAILRLRAQRAS
jgi:Rrf2 family nitric oxide-sensitive transcriptional repressor